MEEAGTFRNQVDGQVGRDLTTKFSKATVNATIAELAGPAPKRVQGSTLDIGDGADFALTSLAVCRGG
jgi:hypothetical protein